MRVVQHLQKPRIWLLLGLLVVSLVAGCATTDDADNISSKPWNSPEGFQNGGLPSALTQPH